MKNQVSLLQGAIIGACFCYVGTVWYRQAMANRDAKFSSITWRTDVISRELHALMTALVASEVIKPEDLSKVLGANPVRAAYGT